MKKLFIDASVNPQLRIGIGSYLFLEHFIKIDYLEDMIQSKMFENTSSTKLELECFLWAIENINIEDKIIIYTDCQNILSLIDRKNKILSNNFFTKTGKLLINHELYKKFYEIYDENKFEIIKIKGHKPKSEKDEIDKIFSLVDKKARKELKKYLKK